MTTRTPVFPLLLTVGLGVAVLTSRLVAAHPGAKVLFYDPGLGQPAPAPIVPAALTGLVPVRTRGSQFVGVHYWFENEQGVKFAEAGQAGMGARVRMPKLDRIAAGRASDGESVLVREVDRTTPGQVGTYVVHRTGGQPGEELSFAAKGPTQATKIGLR
jgi:hypothetical protein